MSSIGLDAGGQVDVAAGTERPLSDYERAMVQRLLSDPFVFPIQFKTWLISFLEGGDILLPKSSVQGLTSALGTGGGAGIMGILPAGLIFPYAGPTPPQGALLCDGVQYSTTAYERLFKAIGYAFGGSGSLFAVPDLRRRVPFGAGAGRGLGGSDGKVESQRDIDHHHDFGQTSGGGGSHSHGGSTDSQGSHSHGNDSGLIARTNLVSTPLGSGGTSRYIIDGSTSISAAGSHSHNIGTDTHPGHTHFVSGATSGGFENNHPSYLTVGFIINF